MKIEKVEKKIIKHLSYVKSVIESNMELGYRDVTKTAQRFVCGLFNIVYDLNLKDLDEGNKFATAIDLGDLDSKIAYQITYSNGRDKVQKTINKFEETNLDNNYDELKVFIIGKKKSYSKEFETKRIKFLRKGNIEDFYDLEKYILDIKDYEKLIEINKYLEKNISYETFSPDFDRELIEFFLSCFDREAFKRTIYIETCIENLQRAIEDTLIAINTGVLKDRKGNVIKEFRAKTKINNAEWQSKFGNVTEILSDINFKLENLTDYEKNSDTNGNIFYNFQSPETPKYINDKRNECIDILNSIAEELNLNKLDYIS